MPITTLGAIATCGGGEHRPMSATFISSQRFETHPLVGDLHFVPEAGATFAHNEFTLGCRITLVVLPSYFIRYLAVRTSDKYVLRCGCIVMFCMVELPILVISKIEP
jgi:hypothetical protein